MYDVLLSLFPKGSHFLGKWILLTMLRFRKQDLIQQVIFQVQIGSFIKNEFYNKNRWPIHLLWSGIGHLFS